MSDLELLHTYAATGSNDAFAQLVARHLGFVYAAALRQTRSTALAEDIAQSVFLDLARHAVKLRRDTHLASWLCVITRRTAIDCIRRESRRREREQIATELAAMDSSDSSWAAIAPVIDEALTSLSDTDRRAVLLRFFENKSLEEIGRDLGVSGDTAQKRLSRAVDRLRTVLARRGLTTTAALLATQIPLHATAAAPVSLLTTLSSPAFFAAAATSSVVSTSFAHTLLMTATNKTVLATVLACAIASVVYEAAVIKNQNDHLVRTEILAAGFQTEIASLKRRLSQAEESARETSAVSASASVQAPLDPLEAQVRTILGRVKKLKEMAAIMPDERIPEMDFLTDNDWMEVAMKRDPETATDFMRSFTDLRGIAKQNFAPKAQTALLKYLAASNDQLPANPAALAPYFDPAIDPAILARYEMRATGPASKLGPREPILGEKRDTAHTGSGESLIEIGPRSVSTKRTPEAPSQPAPPAVELALKEADLAYRNAHPGERATRMDQLRPYFKNPDDVEKITRHYSGKSYDSKP